MTASGQAHPPRTLLGFDYGTRRIGVAVGQEQTLTASPLTVLENRTGRPDWQRIAQLVAQWRPDVLVVGVPVHMDGREFELTEAARRFGRQLQGRYNLPVYAADERLSSEEAVNRTGRRDREPVDAVAAQIILETWLGGPRDESSRIT